MKNTKDHFFWKAKKQGFMARSVYKLAEADEKYHLIRKGLKVLDLGAAPGSWTQFTAQKIGDTGLIVAIDYRPLSIKPPDNVKFLIGNIENIDIKNSTGLDDFDLLLSDMAPKTTGIKTLDQENSYNLTMQAFKIAQLNLKKNGHAFVKTFQGAKTSDIIKLLKQNFKQVNIFKPKSSRSESFEIFLLASYFKQSTNGKI